ncbi:putative Glycosyltransferase involved in cell wall biogenesis [Vibrio nigripulchritudo SFn27]|uniref:Putative Glycosyltransferase involved in cell wall biogenesis n=1 Tax=Vibrio nigripulchritudo TaxID=28173 RepID=U4K7P4_9VIBR|nr:glycosyltransferase [Vibrio nigripulchritudo]CCN82139.1 putative Glycosyltransferase involved in cell wall biogenesis [Vibrio nigripulchritudo BLFn1]CCN86389.1 putative Glycosyltransferase involved in cell wall biogenesis [Vibrio nigripulchritudo SFn27]CCN96776.1 putative Glycosyltransferase involved in cell wall biogenesis [Vibrio nigripulchritudo ENn2]CCO39530.1 putative Glycosyltransferase involved in cell wall biogenesis [Vibrio nigripulchritudo SFn135]CCO52100.1 putative Glycosyltransf
MENVNTPSVDITILSWDRIDDTLDAIDSALSQQGIDLKVIVVDQGSKPDGLAKLRQHCLKDSRIQLVCNRQNLGVPGGRNQASDQGTGEFIVALDNDAEFVDEHQLAKACELMRSEPELGALAFRILRFGSQEDDLTSWSYHDSASQAAETTFYTDRFVGAGHMLRRKAFDGIKGYDSDLFFLHEEVDLSKRLMNAHYKIKYSPEVVIGHKVSAEHRVAWTGGRWTFDVRNKTYLHFKFRTFLPTAVFHTSILVWRGIRSGLIWSTFKGLFQGFGMVPKAVRAWKTQPAVVSDAQAKAYMDSCSPTQGMTVMQRVKMRLQSAKPVPVKPKG